MGAGDMRREITETDLTWPTHLREYEEPVVPDSRSLACDPRLGQVFQSLASLKCLILNFANFWSRLRLTAREIF